MASNLNTDFDADYSDPEDGLEDTPPPSPTASAGEPITPSQEIKALEHALDNVLALPKKHPIRWAIDDEYIANIFDLLMMSEDKIDKLTYFEHESKGKQRRKEPLQRGSTQLLLLYIRYNQHLMNNGTRFLTLLILLA